MTLAVMLKTGDCTPAVTTPLPLGFGSIQRLREILQMQPALARIGGEGELHLAGADAVDIGVEPTEPVDFDDHVRFHFGRVVGLDGDAADRGDKQLAPYTFIVVFEMVQPSKAAPAKLTSFGV